jgi:transposase
VRSVGLDLGSRKIAYCEVAGEQVVERGMVTGLEGLQRWLGPTTEPARVAIEACREAWVVHTKLSEWGHQVLLVDTTRSKRLGIGQHGRKNDRIDAEVLARAVERGGIPTAHVLSPARRELREHLSIRRTLVETRAQYVMTIRGMIRGRHAKQVVGTCRTKDFVAKLREAALGESTRELVAPLVACCLARSSRGRFSGLTATG